MQTFGQALKNFVEDYKRTLTSKSLLDFCSSPKRISVLQKTAPELSSDDIKKFLVSLFTNDPTGETLKETSFTEIQDDAPYKYGVKDIPKYKCVDKPEFITVVQPKCEECQKTAYFGLPFCPWCMKQIPPYYPKCKGNVKASVHGAVVPLNDIEITPPKNTITVVEAGVEKEVKLSDVFIDDGDVRVTYGDIEQEKKTVSKYIPY